MKFSFGALLLLSSLWLLLLGVIALSRGPVRPVEIDLPGDLRPGQPMPGGAACSWYPVSYTVCYGQRRDFYFTYDARRGAIVHASTWFYERGLTIGALILAWGWPAGYRPGYVPAVLWPHRYVYVIGPQFGPEALVAAIIWDDGDGERSQPWQGFRTR